MVEHNRGYKCLVEGCENHSNEGMFARDLCGPCHKMITTGKVGHGHTFIQDMHNELSYYQKLFKDLGDTPVGIRSVVTPNLYKIIKEIKNDSRNS